MDDEVRTFRREALQAGERRRAREERAYLTRPMSWPQATALIVFFVSLAAMVWAIAWAMR